MKAYALSYTWTVPNSQPILDTVIQWDFCMFKIWMKHPGTNLNLYCFPFCGARSSLNSKDVSCFNSCWLASITRQVRYCLLSSSIFVTHKQVWFPQPNRTIIFYRTTASDSWLGVVGGVSEVEWVGGGQSPNQLPWVQRLSWWV